MLCNHDEQNELINARELIRQISFIHLNVRRRICHHLEFLTIRLNLVIKSMINHASLIGGTPIGVNMIKLHHLVVTLK